LKARILEIISNSLSVLELNKTLTHSDVKEITDLIYDKIKLNSSKGDIHPISQTHSKPKVTNSFAGINFQR